MKKNLNAIGLDKSQAKLLADKLNILLANYQVFYLNNRGYHWNIQGEKFFELHLKFEELYTNLQLKIDEIAERILTLGKTPYHSFEDFLKNASIAPQKNVSEGRAAVEQLLVGLQQLLVLQRDILLLSAEANDEGTNALMSDYIREQEKLVWMYGAFLKG
jgi:starvation-inducible DNA-binding protein